MAMQLAPPAPHWAAPDNHSGQVRIDFAVSQNEEHVRLQVASPHAAVTLGERAHHYSLLVLARLRLRDAGRGLDPSSQGWIETDMLAASLGLDVAHLNIHIFRARSQLRRAAAQLGATVEPVERRRCELRFGSYSFHITRGSHSEGVFVADQAVLAGASTGLGRIV